MMEWFININALALLAMAASLASARGLARFVSMSQDYSTKRGTDRMSDSCPSRPSGDARGLLSGAAGWTISFFALMMIVFISTATAATPPGTVVNNLATVTYTNPSATVTASMTDIASFTVEANVTAATVSLFEYSPVSPSVQWIINAGDYRDSGSIFQPMPVPVFPAGSSTPINLSVPVPLDAASLHHMGDPLFIVIDDMDQNLDQLAPDSILVTMTVSSGGDIEVIRLYETGVATGVFTGFVNTADAVSLPASPYDSQLSIQPGSSITLDYTDNGSSVTVSVLADQPGRVFDSRSGAALDGFTVSILDSFTGFPAMVNGDDGFSSFPNVVVTGGTYVDSSGKSYVFSAGQYRFPFLRAGDYILVVTPPAGFSYPSVVSDAAIQSLPGAPFSLSGASRGVSFTLSNDSAIQVDLPVDSSPGALFITKTPNRDNAAIGDHLQYLVRVDEMSGNTVYNATVVDKLPPGFVYVAGSTMVNGSSAPDPGVSTDRRTLTFTPGDIVSSGSVEIKYVVEVAAGAMNGMAVNRAQATGSSGETSNIAQATVRIYEDLMRSRATIMGRVTADACGLDPEAKGEGVKGVRIYMENGSYVITDDNGNFHFKGVTPGTHVVQLDYDSLSPQYEPAICNDSTEQAGSAFSRFVELQGGTLWRTDFHLGLKPRNKGELKVQFNSSVTEPDTIEYSVPVNVGKVPIDNVRVTFMLPEGVRYYAGSSTLNAEALDEPEIVEGSLTYRLGTLSEGSSNKLKFRAKVALDELEGKFLARMMVTYDTVVGKNMRTPVLDNVLISVMHEKERTTSFVISTQFEPLSAELSARDMKELDALVEDFRSLEVDHVFTFGHTDSLPLSKGAKRLYSNNYDLSRERARSVANYIGRALGLGARDISFVGHGPDRPVADNSTREGRMKNRRVEIKIYYQKVEKMFTLSTRKGKSGEASVETEGLRGTHQRETETFGDDFEKPVPEFDALWMSKVEEGLAWVWPETGYYPSIAALTMAIKHEPGSELVVTLNGRTLNRIYIENVRVDDARTKAVTIYKGIPLDDGPNEFVVKELVDGELKATVTHTVHYSTDPVNAEYLPGKSRLLADGRTNPVIAVRLTDRYGHPARRGLMGEYAVASPHKPAKRDEGVLDSLPEGRMRYRVGGNGVAYIRLAPTADSGEAALTFYLLGIQEEVKAWLSPEMREWILVGFAEGTVGHATLKGNAEALSETGFEEGTYTDGKVSFFAKGRVKGKWLLTMAYDSSKPSYNEYELHSIIDPDEYYTLYGDSTEQGNEAGSARKLYLKIESGKFYALFGDYSTGLTVTRLSRYSRSMSGFKAEYNGEKARYKVFASDTSQAFVKDEIPGDGTSGLYRLTRKNIVRNSDKVYIEVRDRFRPDVVLETRTLSRHIDYDIDYMEGTLFFRQPVNSFDTSFNPLVIVVDYESFDGSDTSYNYGGRGAVSIAGDKLELGATYVHEESVGMEGDLSGYDATLRLDKHTEVKGEFATTDTTSSVGTSEGSAYLIEVRRKQSRLNAALYLFEHDENFGLGQQSVSERGLRRYGFDFSYEATRQISVNTRLYRENNLVTDAEREFGEADLRYRMGSLTYIAGLRSVTDTFSDGSSLTSEQFTAGLEWITLNNRLILKALRDQAMSGSDDNADYPTRTTLGAEYKLSGNASLFANQEYLESDSLESEATRAGIKASPWDGANVNSSLERQFNENGSRVFSNFGLIQDLRLNEKWAMSASLDSRDTLTTSTAPSVHNAVSFAGEDFTAVSVGANYSRAGLSWRTRLEYRNAESYDKSGIFSAVNGEPRAGLGLSAGIRSFRTSWADGSVRRDMSLRLGFVRRPASSRWTVLDRLDYISEQESGGQFEFDTWKLVNNLNANYKVEEEYQVSIQYGSKYVKDSIDGQDYKGYTDLTGLELRYNINSKWDIGPRFSVLHSWEPGRYDYQSGLSVGYSPAMNVWVSLGYNFDGFRDKDFTDADYSAAGPYLRFKVKFDQLSAKDAVRYFTGN